jgi:hypothetical protein
MKTLDTLIEDIYSVLENGVEVTDEQVEAAAKRIAGLLRDKLKKRADREPRLYMSLLGKRDRQIYWEMKGLKAAKPEPWTLLKFLYGDVIEEVVLFLAEASGHTVTDRQKTITIDGVNGRMDCKIDGVTVDVKGTTSYSMPKFEDLAKLKADDSFGYMMQLGGYIQAEKEDKGAFLAFDRSLGHMALLNVPVSETPDVAARIKEIREFVAKDTPPDREVCSVTVETNGNTALSSPCSYCSFKGSCHPGLRTFLYSSGPKFFTEVVKEPRVPELMPDGTIREYDRNAK